MSEAEEQLSQVIIIKWHIFLDNMSDPLFFTDGPTSLNKAEYDSIPVNETP